MNPHAGCFGRVDCGLRTPTKPGPRRGTGWWFSALAAAALLAGCAAPSEPLGARRLASDPPHPDFNLPRARVGLVCTSTLPLLRIQWPQSRREAMREVDSQAYRVLGTAGAFFPAAFAAAPYLSAEALAAGVGGISEKDRARNWEAYQEAMPKVLIPEGIRRAVADQAQIRGDTNLFLVGKPWPQVDPKQFQRMAFFIAGTLAWLPRGVTVTNYLRSQGADSVLELAVNNAALAGKLGRDQPVALSFDLEARLIRLEDAAIQGRLQLHYQGPSKHFAEWMQDGGGPFLAELQTAYRACAGQILDWWQSGSATPAPVR